MQFYKVKNWSRFQHYKERNPPWIKLHYEMLTSSDWVMLADASKLLAVVCMLIASRNNGMVPASPEYIKRVAYLTATPNFKPLLECGFLEKVLADDSGCLQMIADARPETETETETEKNKTKVLSKKISLDELSVDHIAQWLMEKRTIGKYLCHDEHYILERFKDYCRSKGKRYNDYVAAYRNAFEWDTCQPKPKGTDPASKAFTAAQSIIAKRNAAAGIGGSAEPVNSAFATSLRLPENIR